VQRQGRARRCGAAPKQCREQQERQRRPSRHLQLQLVGKAKQGQKAARAAVAAALQSRDGGRLQQKSRCEGCAASVLRKIAASQSV